MAETIAVAMSGGVDSGVAAALLKREGYQVVGLTMFLWGEGSRCCSLGEVRAAHRIAQRLGIPHYTLDLRAGFQKEVVDCFLIEYKRGRTPNPCAVCNQRIKFGLLLGGALSLGARYLATGHYARLEAHNGRISLKRGADTQKDQSYFLARLNQEALSSALFPLGGLKKREVKKLAQGFGLSLDGKRESQEVCFLPSQGLASFLRERLGNFQAKIIDKKGRVLGTTESPYSYTLGQRKGLKVAGGKPLYVLEVKSTGEIVLGEEKDLYAEMFWATQPNWIEKRPKEELRVWVKIRSRQKPSPALLWPQGERVMIRFDLPQRAITPGQLAVFYQGDTVLGSGWIDEVG